MTQNATAAKAPATRKPAATPAAPATPPVLLELTFSATKETAGTVRYDTTEECAKALGGRGTNIYIPKSMIPAGGLRPTIKVLIVEG